MPLKDRFRRAIGRTSPDSTRSSSVSSSSSSSQRDTLSPTTTIVLPAITLTKTSSRLSKITSFRSNKSKKDKWEEPKSKYPAIKNTKHQEMLKSFEWKFGRAGRPSIDGAWSCYSGISPMASRNVSVDESALQRIASAGRRTSRVSVTGGSSRQASRVEELEAATVEEE